MRTQVHPEIIDLLQRTATCTVSDAMETFQVRMRNNGFVHNVAVTRFPTPKMVVMEGADRVPGIGAFFGEIHTRIAQKLGCVAYVSNGAVQWFADGLNVSHRYAHVVDFGAAGDLLQRHANGIQIVPLQIADRLPERVAAVVTRQVLKQEPPS